jgi:hypothetical protein
MEAVFFSLSSKPFRTTTRRPASRFFVCIISLSLALSAPYGIAQTDSDVNQVRAGGVIVVSGAVVARDSSGSERQLRRRSDVFVGDTIHTAADATTQIRMVDGALIALKEATEFSIVAYQYEENPNTDVSSIELIAGGFRTITGSIDEQNRENYSAGIAQFATIGIRGTDYEVVITPAGEVITGVYDGGTTIANDVGQMDLGIGADYDYAIVPDPDTPPVGLLLQPPELGSVPLAATTNDDDDGGDGGDDGNDDADDSDSNDDGGDDSDDGDDSGNDDSGDDAGDAGNDGADDAAGATDPANVGDDNTDDGGNNNVAGADAGNDDTTAVPGNANEAAAQLLPSLSPLAKH